MLIPKVSMLALLKKPCALGENHNHPELVLLRSQTTSLLMVVLIKQLVKVLLSVNIWY